MKLVISPEVAAQFPDLRIGWLVARIPANEASDERLIAALRQAEAAVRSRFADAAALDGDHRITAWREVYRSFGTNPKKYRPSAEALLRRVVRGDALTPINRAVDAYVS